LLDALLKKNLEVRFDVMNDWPYVYIKFLLSISEPFYKEPGWSFGLKNNYVVLTEVRS